MSKEYATKHFKPADRFAFWRDVICDAYLPIHCASPDASAFRGRIELDRLSKLNVSRVTGSTQHITRRKDHIARNSDSFFMLSLQLSDVGHLSQSGRSSVLQPGDFGLYTTSEPYEISCRGPVNQLVVQIPHETLLAHIPQAEMLTGLGVSASTGIGGMVSQQLRQCAGEVAGQSVLVQTHMQDMMIDLVAAGFATLAEDKVVLGRPDQLLLARAKSVIRDHLREDHLTPAYLAQSVGMSPRNLARAFRRDGKTIAAYIRQARLEAISQELIDPRFVAQSVSQIACKWGLHNFQHFSKQFKDAYGMTPRSWRATQRVLQ
jgi:AraC-like DNA-binding protein